MDSGKSHRSFNVVVIFPGYIFRFAPDTTSHATLSANYSADILTGVFSPFAYMATLSSMDFYNDSGGSLKLAWAWDMMFLWNQLRQVNYNAQGLALSEQSQCIVHTRLLTLRTDWYEEHESMRTCFQY